MNARANSPCVDIELKNHGLAKVGWLWMDRSFDDNAIDRQMAQELTRGINLLAKDGDVRVIVLAARGDYFSCGTELGWLRAQASSSFGEAMDDARRLAQLLQALADCGKPTIARVQGRACGIGAGLAAACDICVVTERAAFAVNDEQLGMMPSVIAPYLVRAIGARQCQRYFLTNENIDAARARELGLAHEVIDHGLLDEQLTGMIGSLLLCDPQAQTMATRLIRLVTNAPASHDVTPEAIRAGAKLRARPSARSRLGMSPELPVAPVQRGLFDRAMLDAD